MNISNHTIKRTALATAMAATLGTAAIPAPSTANPYTFSWTGYFTMLTSVGNPLANTSITSRGANQYQTPITGTLVYDTTTATGTMTVAPFAFYDSAASQPATATGITFEDIGGNLLLGNMLFDWNGNYGIPVTIVWNAKPLQDAIAGGMAVGSTLSNADLMPGDGVAPASDDTYTDGTFGYLNLGPTPVATTTWNSTVNAAACNPSGAKLPFPDGCMGTAISGILPLVADPDLNTNKSYTTNVYGIGGIPMWDGPFYGFNANFDLTWLRLDDDGNGPDFTAPANVNENPVIASVPDTYNVNLGTVNDETGTTTITYSIDGKDVSDGTKTWIADDGTNTISVPITQRVNTLTVDWRGVDPTLPTTTTSYRNQTVTVTVNDTVDPTINVVPADVTVDVNSTSETVIFEGGSADAMAVGANAISVSDNIELATLEWSLDNLNWTADTAGDESSNGFNAGANTVYWRAIDASGNTTLYQQTVTLNLPSGIVGTPCEPDDQLLNGSIGDRVLEGKFTMRTSAGGLVGTVDTAVYGTIDPSVVCANTSCTDSGADLASPTPFFGNLWTTNTIRLFNNAGTYTFNTVQDGNPTLTLNLAAGKLGGHMLFDWSVNKDIDVVVSWDYSCGEYQLVSGDPDGDGVIGTRMVDGPFKGFNAAFDLRTVSGQRPLTTGGYSVTVPAVKNPVPNSSPIALTSGTIGSALGGVSFTAADLRNWGASGDDEVTESCVGGCFDFTVGGLGTGDTIQVALPLSEPIPYYSIYRKYDAATDSWVPFVNNGTDSVMTAPLNDSNRCPEPGSSDYTAFTSEILADMLRPGDQCVQLTITDGGPNDDDPTDGVIADPSGVGLTSGPSTPTTSTSGGGCSMTGDLQASQRLDLWLLAGLLGWLAIRRHRMS